MIVSPVVTRLTAGFIIAFAMLLAKSWAAAPVNFADETTCKADRISIPADLLPYVAQEVSGQPINLEADQIDVPVAETLILKGNAFATQGARGIYGDEITFDKSTLSLEATNAVLYTEKGDRITADSLQLDIETRIGSARNVTLQLARREPLPKRKVVDFTSPAFSQAGFSAAAATAPGSVKGPPLKSSEAIRLSTGEFINLGQTPAQIGSPSVRASAGIQPAEVKAKARATADALFLEGHDRERLQNVIYSRCVAGDDSVLIEASELTLDHASGVATGEHVKVRFYGVPIAYAPRLSFPITDERKSGLLFPTVGFGGDWGFNLEVPYYWNMAPQHDATFAGRYMAKRGLLASGEYRYLGETPGGRHDGMVRGEYMPDDSQVGSSRYGWSYEHNQNVRRWDTNFSLSADVGYVSDAAYLDDLSDNLQVSSASHIPQTVNLSIDPFDIFIENEDLQIYTDVSAYQTLDSSISEDSEPYSRLPGIRMNWGNTFNLNLDSGGYLRDDSTQFSLRPEFDSELVNFGHSAANKTKGLRLELLPAIALPIKRTYGEIRPKLTYAYTAYNVSNQAAGKPSSPTRGIYLFEIDSKLFLEREVGWQAQSHIQTLVPSLSYHYVPYEDQDDLPVFDSGSVSFDNIADAFLQGGFWGSDRIQNFQGFTLGLSSDTYHSRTGDPLMNWSLAQRIYLADREVTLEAGSGADTSEFSPFVGEIDFFVTQNIETNGFIKWDWDLGSVDVWRAGARYSSGLRRELGMSYSWQETESNLELDFTWPLSPRWQVGGLALLGQSDYGDDGSYTRISLGYDACCWAVKVALEDRPHKRDVDNGVQFMATFSLKGLGSISSNELTQDISITAPRLP